MYYCKQAVQCIANSDIKGMPDFINPMNFISKMVFIFYKTQFENDGLGCLTFWLLSTFMNICLCGRVFIFLGIYLGEEPWGHILTRRKNFG